MADRRTQCPKCGHLQSGGSECLSCGVIFARYEKTLQRRREMKEQKAEEKQARTRRMRVVGQFLLLGVFFAGITVYFFRSNDTGKVSQSVASSPAITRSAPVASAPEASSVERTPVVEPVRRGGDIEYAREATVSVETPWGTGSGFFVSANYMVTNKHVVEVDQNQLNEFRHKVDAARKMVKLEREKIRNWKRRLKKMPDGPSREQLRIIIAETEQELEQFLPEFEEARQRLEKMEQPLDVSEIKIILADGSEHYANFMLKSERYDLTLLAVTVAEHPVLKPAPKGTHLKQGDKVYTIGSPVGLRNTVTAGIFSGYRENEKTGNVFLQTDAPINPGNSGGPLIDERGYVWGVNTMILRNTEGIGFAIPIENVFEDFGASLY